MRNKALLSVIILTIFFSLSAEAHKPSYSFLNFNVQDNVIDVKWDIPIRDLDFFFGIDQNYDGEVTWGEFKETQAVIDRYMFSKLNMKTKALKGSGAENTHDHGHHHHHHGKTGHKHHHGKGHSHAASSDSDEDLLKNIDPKSLEGSMLCKTSGLEYLVDKRSDGSYIVSNFSIVCPQDIASLKLDYDLFFEYDPQHKGLFKLSYQNKTISTIFSSDDRSEEIQLADISYFDQFKKYLSQGMWHIWTGLDHILFLLALILAAVLMRVQQAKTGGNLGAADFFRSKKTWMPCPSFSFAFWNIFKIITAFTLAHSITVSLAALGIIELNSRLVESIVALSIIVAAANNLIPNKISKLMPEFFSGNNSTWLIAFAFGLIHGFSFASTLGDLDLPTLALIIALLAFNMGVELGQLAIVAVFIPFAFWLRKTEFYEKFILGGGSIVIILIAALWFIERVLDLSFLTF